MLVREKSSEMIHKSWKSEMLRMQQRLLASEMLRFPFASKQSEPLCLLFTVKSGD